MVSRDSATAFALLHPRVQRQLWRMGWKDLRPLQVQAIHVVIQTRQHVLLCAATASGKTEAAFLPVLSQVADDGPGSVRAVYVGPLKALINDQFERVEDLCGYLDLPVHRWHGEVAESHKSRLLQSPGGVLLITPESLESLFVNHPRKMTSLFAGLRFVVIDEVHSFLDNERGLHLRSLLSRLFGIAAPAFRVIGLSATIGDTELATRYIDADHPERVELVNDSAAPKELKLGIHGYRLAGDPAEARAERLRAANDMVAHCRGSANLVFANSKADVEEFAALCSEIAGSRSLPDEFVVHHGSLSADLRRDAEARLKSGSSVTAFCSSTLEMGIDIGGVRMVGQIGPPSSIASMKQRLGRSGRKSGQSRVMRMYVFCPAPGEDGPIFERLRLPLVQAVAATELLLGGWVEPPALPRCDLSTLSQQIISLIAQTGGIRADALYQQLCVAGPFRDIEASLFAQLLRSLAAHDVVEQMDQGDLILGLKGELIRKDKSFYAVFPTPEQYTILHNGVALGTIETRCEIGDDLLFAGRRWEVIEIDEQALELHVEPAMTWRRPSFSGAAVTIHPELRRKMLQVLRVPDTYPYLDPVGRLLLQEARQAAQSCGVLDGFYVRLSSRKTAIMTWTGTRIQQTLQAVLGAGGTRSADEGIALVLDLSLDQTREVVAQLVSCPPPPNVVARVLATRHRRKYDGLLTDDLLDCSLVSGWLDIEGAMDLLAGLH